jgi:hypothetical protein
MQSVNIPTAWDVDPLMGDIGGQPILGQQRGYVGPARDEVAGEAAQLLRMFRDL